MELLSAPGLSKQEFTIHQTQMPNAFPFLNGPQSLLPGNYSELIINEINKVHNSPTPSRHVLF